MRDITGATSFVIAAQKIQRWCRTSVRYPTNPHQQLHTFTIDTYSKRCMEQLVRTIWKTITFGIVNSCPSSPLLATAAVAATTIPTMSSNSAFTLSTLLPVCRLPLLLLRRKQHQPCLPMAPLPLCQLGLWIEALVCFGFWYRSVRNKRNNNVLF